jgi:TonB family protein
MFSLMVQGATLSGPSRFYTVSTFFSDNGGWFYYRILDVQQEGPDALIRHIRIAPANVYCRRRIVQAVEKRVRGESPATLVRENNPCAVKTGALRASVKRYRRREGVFEAISFGIIAHCGTVTVAMRLPMNQQIDLERLREAQPSIAHLWDLPTDIVERAFGKGDIFHDQTDDADATFQIKGQELVSDLLSGQFDAGLQLAVSGNVGGARTFKSVLADYRGPIDPREAKTPFEVQVVNAQAYEFSRFVSAVFPPLAKQARIQGRVELQLTVEPSTGRVNNAAATSGHPVLIPSAIDAAKQWQFRPNAVPPEKLSVTLEYVSRCP